MMMMMMIVKSDGWEQESFFLQTLRCRGGSGEVLVAAQELGDIAFVQLGRQMQGLLVTEGGAVLIASGPKKRDLWGIGSFQAARRL